MSRVPTSTWRLLSSHTRRGQHNLHPVYDLPIRHVLDLYHADREGVPNTYNAIKRVLYVVRGVRAVPMSSGALSF